MTTYRTDFIPDITISDRMTRELADLISDAVEDRISDLVIDIASQYLPLSEEDLDSDEFADQVHNPLYDRILQQAVDRLLSAD